jgi:hypothetical protein
MLESLVLIVRREKLLAGKLGVTVWKEKTRCWESWYWQFRKKKFDAGKLGTGS